VPTSWAAKEWTGIMRKAYRKPTLRKVGQLKDITRGFTSQ